VIRFINFQKERVTNSEITESTLRNYYKPIKLFCEMNDIQLAWKKIAKGIPRARSASNDRSPTIDEIRAVLNYPDRRIKPIILTMISSGIRLGAWDYLRWGEIEPIIRGEEVVAAKIKVYRGEPDEYMTFVTPEAYNALKEWIDYRAQSGEKITQNSWVMRDLWDAEHYRIKNSWQFIPKNLDDRPYKEFVENMYNKRLELKLQGDALQLPLKTILNSIYGKTAQKQHGYIGNLFNPIICASITGKTRARMYDFVARSRLSDSVVSFATDSICFSKEVDIHSNALGALNLDKHSNDAYYLQNGIYRFGGDWKKRGLGRLKGKTFEHVKTIVKQGRIYLEMSEDRVSHLRSCIIQSRLHDIGRIKPERRLININSDRKRFWIGSLSSVDDATCNDSMPFSLNHIVSKAI